LLEGFAIIFIGSLGASIPHSYFKYILDNGINNSPSYKQFILSVTVNPSHDVSTPGIGE
jgi:hypothetical protein